VQTMNPGGVPGLLIQGVIFGCFMVLKGSLQIFRLAFRGKPLVIEDL